MSEVTNNTVLDSEENAQSDIPQSEQPTDLQNTNDNLPEEELKPISADGEAQDDTEKEKVSFKDRINKIIHNPKFIKVQNIILFSLKLLPAFLCLLQLVIWGFAIKENYKAYWNAMITLDYINIVMIAFSLIFVIALLVTIGKDIIRVIKKQEEILFETLSTYVAFYLFKLFVESLFNGKTLLISDFSFSPILTIVTIFILVYSIIRLFREDIGSRWYGVLFSVGAIALVSVMYSGNIGNFATFTFENANQITFADLNIVKYIQALIGSEQAGVSEEILLSAGEYLNIRAFGMSFDENIVVVLLQTVSILASTILPFAALSMLGYLMFGLMSKNYIQFMKLNYCKKATIAMLVASILSLASTIAMSLLFNKAEVGVTVQIDYNNVVTTILTLVVLMVLTSMPWKIYNIIYKHRYSVYKKSEGGTL